MTSPFSLLRSINPFISQKAAFTFGMLFASYIIAAQLGILLYTSPAVLTPAAGVALAGLWLGGISQWPAIFLGSLVVQLMNGFPLANLLIFPFAQTLQAVVGAYLLQRFKLDERLARVRDMFAIMAVSVCAAVTVPTVGYIGRYVDNWFFGGPLPSIAWSSWWVGLVLSHLIIAPFVIRWVAHPMFTRTFLVFCEIIAAFTLLLSVVYCIFILEITSVYSVSLIYVLLIPLMWIALRLGSRFITLAFFFLAACAIVGTFLNSDLTEVEQLGRRLFQVEVFLCMLASIFFVLTAVAEERIESAKKLISHVSQLEDALNQIRIRDAAKSEFLAVLAHELRNPLSPVVSSLELLRAGDMPEPERTEVLNVMDGNMKTMRRLLDDLFDVSRISQRKLKLKKELIDVHSVLHHVVHSIENKIRERNQTLTTRLSEQTPLIEADPIRIEQILTNLLSNASKFTDVGGTISVSVRTSMASVSIRVQDSGVGVAPDMLEKIFEPFHQIRGERLINEGLGIGLSLTKKLVEEHGGTIVAKSEGLGKGSVFEITLPLSHKTPEAEENILVAHALRNPKDIPLLVVDDNIEAARGIQKLLSHAGFPVHTAFNGKDALSACEAHTFSVVVLDIGLPDINGHEVARRLREEQRFTGLLIALTGYGQSADKEKAIQSGFDTHLTKPIRIQELTDVMTNYFENKA